MWLLREKLSDFGVKQILHRVDIALYVHPKNSLRSHSRAIMVLDHRKYTLRAEATFSAWKTNQTEFFVFEKFTLQILANKSGCMQTNLLFFFIHHIWGERVLWGAVFIIQTSTKCSISQFFKTNCIHSIFRTIEARVDF